MTPIVDGHLESQSWFPGDDLSIIDFMFGAISRRRTCQMPLDNARHVLAWYDRMQALPAWASNFQQSQVV